MRILYDSNLFLSYKVGGISRYHYELLKGIKSNVVHDVKVAGKFIKNEYLRRDEAFRSDFFYDPTASFAMVNQWLVKRCLRKGAYDLFHPGDVLYFDVDDIPRDKKVVFTIHDMINEKIYSKHNQQKFDFAQRADKIIAVSQATKNDIVEIYGIPANKIDVIYHGSSLTSAHTSFIRHIPHKIPQEFLLFVGNRSGYKNFSGFIQGIAPLLRKNPDLFLVCIGKKGFSKAEETSLQELNIRRQTVCYVGVNDNLLAYFYAKAKAFVFPSLMEGFGIPILEAWACGTPVVLTDNACFREVAADAGSYFSPSSPESICETISKVLFDKELSKDLVENGKKRLELFSWEKTVEKTVLLYESLV
jgi:glycosyltransferase involved in cell wall biosynthesis